MNTLYDIRGYWKTRPSESFNEQKVWEGQLILREDGWVEGIVTDPTKAYAGDMLIFGAFFEGYGLELIKMTPSDISDSFVFKGHFDNSTYIGKFDIIDLFGNTPFRECKIIIAQSTLDSTQNIEERIIQWKQENSQDEIVTSFYNNTSSIRK